LNIRAQFQRLQPRTALVMMHCGAFYWYITHLPSKSYPQTKT